MTAVDDSRLEWLRDGAAKLEDESFRLVKTVDSLLFGSEHTANKIQAATCIQEFAKDFMNVVVKLGWVACLVDMLHSRDRRAVTAALSALAAVSTKGEGREAIRRAGGVKPLCLLLKQHGINSDLTISAACTLSSCCVDDGCKVALCEVGLPALMDVLRAAGAAVREAHKEARQHKHTDALRLPAGEEARAQAAAHAAEERRKQGLFAKPDAATGPGASKAALYVTGVLMNLVQVEQFHAPLKEASVVAVCKDLEALGPADDPVVTRATFVLNWIAMADLRPPEPHPAPKPSAPAPFSRPSSTAASATRPAAAPLGQRRSSHAGEDGAPRGKAPVQGPAAAKAASGPAAVAAGAVRPASQGFPASHGQAPRDRRMTDGLPRS